MVESQDHDFPEVKSPNWVWAGTRTIGVQRGSGIRAGKDKGAWLLPSEQKMSL